MYFLLSDPVKQPYRFLSILRVQEKSFSCVQTRHLLTHRKLSVMSSACQSRQWSGGKWSTFNFMHCRKRKVNSFSFLPFPPPPLPPYPIDRGLSFISHTFNSSRDLFDTVICSAKKPDFYRIERPFREWNIAGNFASPATVETLEKGRIYVNGSVQALTRAKPHWDGGVLYIGDNMWADLVEARRIHGW